MKASPERPGELCLREALAVCTPPAPEPSAERPCSYEKCTILKFVLLIVSFPLELPNGWLQLVLASLCFFLSGVNKMDTYFRKVKIFQFLLLCPDQKAKDMS